VTPKHQFEVAVDPYRRPGDATSGLLPFVQDAPFGRAGDGDRSVQAYNLRLCFTRNPANRRALEPPPNYDPARYELLARYFEALVAAGKKPALKNFLKIDLVTPEKTDINNNGGFSTDFIGGSTRWPEAGYAERERIYREHLDYVQGLLVFLATSPRVPENVRMEMQQWGPCRDEFTDHDGWPHQLYVREARRMQGAYVLTEHDLVEARAHDDVVALGSYNIDIREVERTWRYLPEFTRVPAVFNEGYLSVAVPPYAIPYRALTPLRDEATDLLAAVCVSASHVAFSSLRMEPTYMLLGHAAGLASAQAARRGVAVQDVDVDELQRSLIDQGGVLSR
ncbi:MAG TPA: FAD-dependent oxidoreductase, partial [Gaiellaceae bacterium]|nr:FAD-dependent oxidoreductase [Gaiellaceae bacterium]